MDYDIKVHLGQQIENFLNGFAAGDAMVLDRTLSNIRDIVNKAGNTEFIGNLKEWDTKKTQETNKIFNKARDALKVLTESKDGADLFVDVEEIKADTMKAFNDLETKYWEAIRELVINNAFEDKED